MGDNEVVTMTSPTQRRIGWVAEVPPNGFRNRPSADLYASNDNPDGLATPENELETTPEHRNLAAGDPGCLGWVRSYDDPQVSAYREFLAANNGIRGLPIVEPHEVTRAVQLFHRDGFVVVRDALTPAQTERFRAATDRQVDRILASDPQAAVGGGAGGLPHRYSFGSSSASRHMLHDAVWCEMIDLPTTTPILTAIFGSADYTVLGGGGDVALPGAIEYQGLHSDNLWQELPDPVGQVSMRDLPVPVLTINFTVCDLTTENGPIRQIPGSQRSRQPIPTLADEPMWMKLSTLCPVPAGSAIFRDNRCWHGGTPNLSRDTRAIPNIEYFAPWFRSEAMIKSMPYERWAELSPHAQRISRYIAGYPGEPILGAGFVDPRSSVREQFKADQLASLDPATAAELLARR